MFGGACASALAEPQKAAANDVVAICRSSSGAEPDARIDACTAALAKSGQSNLRLASLYSDRSLAWLEKRGDPAKALADADQAVQLAPDNAVILASRGLIHSRMNDEARARADLDKAVSLTPEDAVLRMMRGTVLLRFHDHDGAIEDFSEFIRLRPDDAGGRVDRGYTWLLKGDEKRALEDLDQAIQLDPKNAEAYKWRSTAYRRSAQEDLALQDIETAITLDPRDAEALRIRGRIRADQGLSQQALADIDAAAALAPDSLLYVLNRCEMRLQLDAEIETALAACGDALRVRPHDSEALGYRGVLLMKLGRFNEARRDFVTCVDDQLARPAAERDGYDHAFCLYGRGLAAAKINPKDMSAAITDLSDAAQMRPAVPLAYTKYGLPPPRVAAAPPKASPSAPK